MLSMFTTELMEKSTFTKCMNERRKFVNWVSFSFPGFEWYFKVTQLIFFSITQAVARFFVTRGIITRAEGTSLVGGVWGCPPLEKFSNLEAPKSYFQHLS